MSKENYRKKLSKSIGFKIPIGFEVHHIDHRRTNNQLENLVAIPKGLHREYHKQYNKRWAIENDYLHTGNSELFANDEFDRLTETVNNLHSEILEYYQMQQSINTKN